MYKLLILLIIQLRNFVKFEWIRWRQLDFKCTKSLFFIYFIVIEKKKNQITRNKNSKKKEMFLEEISIIIILVFQKLWSVGTAQQKIKFPLLRRRIWKWEFNFICKLHVSEAFWTVKNDESIKRRAFDIQQISTTILKW